MEMKLLYPLNLKDAWKFFFLSKFNFLKDHCVILWSKKYRSLMKNYLNNVDRIELLHSLFWENKLLPNVGNDTQKTNNYEEKGLWK